METPTLLFTHSGLFVATGAALALGWVVALSSALAQGGLVFAPTSLLPTASRMSPAAKLGQLFSINALRGLIKSLLPAAAVTWLAIGCLRRDWPLLMALPARSSRGTLGFAAGRLFEVAWKSALVLLIWSVLDYIFERQHLSKRTEDEPPGNERRIQGDGRQSRHQRPHSPPAAPGAPPRMLEATKRATVVITNPTHYAVALEYCARDGRAHRGRQRAATCSPQQIKEIARWEDIPIVENPPLAQRLYRTVEVGQAIPAKLYAAVAEILACRLSREARALAADGAGRSRR